MGLFGGIMKSVINPMNLAQLAMGPAGWASIAMKAIGTQVLQQAIQMVGQQLGLPQQAISLAQNSIAAQRGDAEQFGRTPRDVVDFFGRASGASPREIGEAQFAVDMAAKNLADGIKRAMGEISGETKKKAAKGGGSWLQVLADSLTKALDATLQKMESRSTQLAQIQKDGGKIKSDNREAIAENQSMTTKAQQDFNVSVQEFSVISNAITNSIKTIGEALTAMARKQ